MFLLKKDAYRTYHQLIFPIQIIFPLEVKIPNQNHQNHVSSQHGISLQDARVPYFPSNSYLTQTTLLFQNIKNHISLRSKI